MSRLGATDFTILTVCTGNICRSPLAEQYLRAGLSELPHVTVSSAGTMALDGDDMPAEMQALARQHGMEPTAHRARYLQELHVSGAQLVLALAREHRRDVVTMWPRASRYAFTLREFARLAVGLTDADLLDIAWLPTDDTAARLTAAVALVASRRGTVPAADDVLDDEVIDPYRRDEATYTLSGQQLIPAADVVVRVLARAASITPAEAHAAAGKNLDTGADADARNSGPSGSATGQR